MGHFALGLGRGSFASKVMDHIRFGFAAGCEAVAMPRRRDCFLCISAMPLGAAFGPIKSEGLSPNQGGHSPRIICLLTAGHSHRREANSGGQAEPKVVHDF